VPSISQGRNLEREKDMQHIFEALIKDIAEQLRPMVADMVRQEISGSKTVPLNQIFPS
jgi:hypothetical protein